MKGGKYWYSNIFKITSINRNTTDFILKDDLSIDCLTTVFGEI